MPGPLLHNQTAVITGAAQGIGFAIAQLFVDEGARVVIGDVNAEAADKAAAQLGGSERAIGVRCDVTDSDDVDALLAAAADAFGPVDVMVNNAGVSGTMHRRFLDDDLAGGVHDDGLHGGRDVGGAGAHGAASLVQVSGDGPAYGRVR